MPWQILNSRPGLAAEQTLGHLKWQPSNDLTVVTTENVGQVFAMVKTGNADAGFVALSQMLEQGVPKDQFSVVNGNFHDPIYQGAVLLKNGSQPARAKDFFVFYSANDPQKSQRRPRMTPPGKPISAANKRRLALLYEGFGCVAMIFGLTAVHMMRGL